MKYKHYLLVSSFFCLMPNTINAMDVPLPGMVLTGLLTFSTNVADDKGVKTYVLSISLEKPQRGSLCVAQPPAPPFGVVIDPADVSTLLKATFEIDSKKRTAQDLVSLIQVLKYRPLDDGRAVEY